MKKQLLVLSLVLNVVLLAGLVWSRAEHEAELRSLAVGAMRGDEIHLELHAQSLAALESGDAAETEATAAILRKLVAAGAANVEARQQAGFGR